jgi:hypothetical protein
MWMIRYTGGSYQVAAYNGVGRSEWVDVDDEPLPIYMAQDSPVEPFVPNWMECVIQGLPDEGLPLDAYGRQFISITGHNSVKLQFDDSQLSVVHEWLDSNLHLQTEALADEDVIATTHDVWFRPAAGATGGITELTLRAEDPDTPGTYPDSLATHVYLNLGSTSQTTPEVTLEFADDNADPETGIETINVGENQFAPLTLTVPAGMDKIARNCLAG